MTESTAKYKLPLITMEQALAYDAEKPETRTVSPLMNAVMDEMRGMYPIQLKKVAERLGVEAADLNGAVKCATGYHFAEFLRLWRLSKYDRIKSEEPKIGSDELAHRLGFYNHTSMWYFLKRENKKVAHRRTIDEINEINRIVFGDRAVIINKRKPKY